MRPIDPLDYIVAAFRPEDLDNFPLPPGALPKSHAKSIAAFTEQAFQKCETELESARLRGELRNEWKGQYARMQLLINQLSRFGLQQDAHKFSARYASIRQEYTVQ